MSLSLVAPPLVDNIVGTLTRPRGQHRLVIAKPYPPVGLYGLAVRLYHAYLVLRGHATAVIFDEDIKDLQ